MVMDDVVAAAGVDDVGAAVAVDRVGAGAADQIVGARGADDHDALRGGQDRGVEILKIGDIDVVADGLVGSRRAAEIDLGHAAGALQHQRIGARAAIDGDFRTVIIDGVVARARVDDVGAAAPVDRVVSGTGRDEIGARRTRHRERRGQGGRVDIFKIGHRDGVADGLILARGRGEVDRGYAARGFHDQRVDAGSAVDGGFRSMVIDGVVARAGVDDIRAATAVDGVGAGAAREDIGARRTRERGALNRREGGGVDILEMDDAGVVAACLIRGVGEIDGRGDLQHQRVVPGSAVDGDLRAPIIDEIVPCPGVDDVGAAAAVDGVVARTREDRVRARRRRHQQGRAHDGRVQIFEIGDVDGIARRLIDAGGDGKINRRDPARGEQDQGIRARAAIDGGL